MIEFATKHRVSLLFSLLLILIYFPIFLHLDYMPFRMWDESIMGVNAIEMLHNHNYIVTYFYGSPDMSNCKPPLMIWCIVLFSKVLGFNELSLRLPSALAALFLCIYLFFILRKITGSPVFGFLTVCVLVTCQGYIRNHVTRTGEYDSLLVLFSTVFALNMFMAVEATNKKQQSKYLFLFFIFMTFGVLTKGIACMMQAPGIFIYVLLRKKMGAFLKDKAFYAGLLFFLVFGIGFYLLRESINPGYIKAVWGNELGGRYAAVGACGGPATFYLNEIVTWQFVNYMFLFPFAINVGLLFSGSKISKLTLYSLIVSISFLIVISFSGTKLPHYDAPMFPYLAIITASLFFMVYSVIREWLNNKRTIFASSLLAFICIFSFLGKPYYDIISKVYFQKGDYWEEGFSVNCRFFQHAARGNQEVSPYKLILDASPGYGATTVLACYKEELAERGMSTAYIHREELKVNDKAVVFNGWTKHLIEDDYEIQTLQHLDYCNADIIYVKSVKIKT